MSAESFSRDVFACLTDGTDTSATSRLRRRDTRHLLDAVHAVIADRLEDLLADRRLAFCYADRPMKYPSDLDELQLEMPSATLVLQTIENYSAALSDICKDLSRASRARVHCAAYVSRRLQAAFDLHMMPGWES